MKNDKETRENLLKSAKKKFMEKGFMQASLRNICKNAGVTTGALYFFFQDKEDLFASLVEKPLQQLHQMMSAHYKTEMELSPEDFNCLEDFEDDFAVAKEVIHFMYQFYDEFQLLLTKSQGSRFEKCVEQFIQISEKHYRLMADRFSESTGTPRVEDFMIHWLSHMEIDAFVHLLTHEKSEEAACRHMESIVRFVLAGWLDMFHKK